MTEYEKYLAAWEKDYPKLEYEKYSCLSWKELFGTDGICPRCNVVNNHRHITPKILSYEFCAEEFVNCICEYEDLGGYYNVVIISNKSAWEKYHAPSPFVNWQIWNR